MDFFRKINKNVQESFSIINEGIQITNGILEIKSVHLPRLLELSPSNVIKNEESSVCCVFEEYLSQRSPGVKTNENNLTSFKESHEPKVKGRLVSKLKFLHHDNLGSDGKNGDKNGNEVESLCSQGENCLLKRFSINLYRESVEFVNVFLSTLSKVLELSNVASKKVLENQSYLILYQISQLYDVPLLLKSQNSKLDGLVLDVEYLRNSLLSIVTLSLKLLNEMLVYPVHIYFNNLNREYDDSKIERRKYDSFLKKRFPHEKIDEYELVGSYSFINIDDDEKNELDQYLLYIDGILDISGNSRPILESLGLTYDTNDAEWNDVFYGFLMLFQKIFSYNDLNWHISQHDANVLYLWNRYYDSCAHYVYYHEHCYDCTKPKMDSDLSLNSDYCVCFLSNERCNFRVKVVVEELFKSDPSLLNSMFDMLGNVKELYIKAKLLGLMCQFMTQIDSFVELFSKHGAADAVFDILLSSGQEQFYLFDTALNALRYEQYKPSLFLSLVNEKDLKIVMSFPPCTIESLVLIHSYVVGSRWSVSLRNSDILVNYAKKLITLYTYYNCTDETSKSMELLGLVSQVLHITLESVLFVQVCLRKMSIRNEIYLMHIVEKLDSVVLNTDLDVLMERFDLELLTMLISSFVILINIGKLGSFVEYQTIKSYSNYLCYCLNLLNGENASDMTTRLSNLTVNTLPEVFKFMLSLLHTKETQMADQLEDVLKIKTDCFNDFESLPLFQTAASLLDPYINTRLINKFTEHVFNLSYKMGLFESNNKLGGELSEYFRTKCEELSSLLDQQFDDGKFIFYRKFTINYTSLLGSYIINNDVNLKVEFLGDYGLNFVFHLISKIVPILKFNSGGNLENIFFSIVNFLIFVLMSSKDHSHLSYMDLVPLYEFVAIERKCVGYSKPLVSVVLLYLFITGVSCNENTPKGANDYLSLPVLSRLHEELNSLYFSKECNSAQMALKVINIRPVDSLGLSFGDSLKAFHACLSNTSKTDLIELFYWNQNNHFSFSLPPSIFERLIAFKLYLHPHLFGSISRCLNRFSEPIIAPVDKTMVANPAKVELPVTGSVQPAHPKSFDKSTSIDSNLNLVDTQADHKPAQNIDHSSKMSGAEFENKSDRELASEGGLEEPMQLMKNLYNQELEFAKSKISDLESQLHALMNSLQLSQMTNQNMKNRIKILEKQVRPGSEDGLEVQLERERQRYEHLEDMYNKLLGYVNGLGLGNT